MIIYKSTYRAWTRAKTWKFPGGEVGASITNPLLYLSEKPTVIDIKASLRNSDELMELLMFLDAVKRFAPTQSEIVLRLPYLPYARQDRVCNPGESLSVAVVARMLNTFNISQVVLYDVHSDVSLVLFDNARHVLQEEIFDLYDSIKWQTSTIVAPDAGAEKKAHRIAKHIGAKEVVTASKCRNVSDGTITGMELHGDVAGKDVLVFDDICDGGATFVHLSNLLTQRGARSKTLFVTHGIFSKGVDAVAPFWDKIYTTNSHNPDLKSKGNVIVKADFYDVASPLFVK